ncbi:GatB/YqeY domain-containing protein [Athalassotoga saccharophila]|uniref:GatB/YqeY domain-containing protein n=1 Tax=Athalassotoga saccharophila TaxID=1441386 RepID=UPI00137B701E|nr:GatB/YqeY domain-containing protein [Athalassotoga saccharophila]BBJ28419.1 glutamyl-tRNA(Gln) amidotransferase [Athalassotoga saccharophila]
MSILEDLRNKLKDAMIAKDEVRTRVLRLLVSAVKNFEVEKIKQISEEEFDAVVKKQIKEREEAIEDFTKGNRLDLAEEEKKELEILKEFARPELSDEEIEKVVSEKIKEMGISSSKEIGKLMGSLMKEFKGKASGDRVKAIAEKLLK